MLHIAYLIFSFPFNKFLFANTAFVCLKSHPYHTISMIHTVFDYTLPLNICQAFYKRASFTYTPQVRQIYFLQVLRLVLLDYLYLLNFLKVHYRGTANTSLPWSNAKSAVIRLPLLSLASVTIIPELNPLIILFLFGKF